MKERCSQYPRLLGVSKIAQEKRRALDQEVKKLQRADACDADRGNERERTGEIRFRRGNERQKSGSNEMLTSVLETILRDY